MKEDRECYEYRHDQKNPVFRKELKRLLASGFSLRTARIAAREVARKPSRKIESA